METNKRPDSMARISTPELAQAFIDEQVAALRAQVGDVETSKAALQKKKEAENEGVVKADLDHAGIAANILAALGGKANVQKASCCATRLRFQLKDGAKVDEKALKSAGASGVIRSTPTACQVILGTQVRFVYEELQKLL